MEDLLKEFLIESHENLDRLDQDLVVLEKEPQAKDTLDSIFRTMHTMKGCAGFLGYGKLEAVAHMAENLLSKMRDGVLVINPDIAGALLATVDVVRQMLAEIEATGAPEDRDYTDLIATLERLKDGGATSEPAPTTPPSPEITPPEPPPTAAPTASEQAPQIRDTTAAADAAMMAIRKPQSSEPTVAATAAPQPAAATLPAPSQAPVASSQAPAPAPTASQSPASAPTVPAAPASAPAPRPKETVDHPVEHKQGSASDSSIRVDVGLLDKLVNLVGELVLARNQILQFTNDSADGAFLATSQRLNLITTELQSSAMKTRMQPIGNIWSKLPRVVRDLATSCGKQIRLEMEGNETELDKTIIEAIKDPLTHIVRNSVDHGIERPEVRQQNGKPAEGCLKMRAYHEGGQVNIEIADDGGGIHIEKVKQKAVQRGLISAEQASRMGDHEAVHLIFMPGFSTAETITNVSGRGVGMDVVRTNIEKIGGTVDIQSEFGFGTVLKIKIPLTLAIIPALIVTSGGERFAIPQLSLLELVRLEAGQSSQQIEYIHNTPVYRLRGKLLPLVSLNRELKLTEAPAAVRAAESGEVNIVVLQADGHPFGLVVDDINDTQEIVVKPLGKQLKGVACFAGATIMGDGRVALILDVLGLAQQSSVVTEIQKRSAVMESADARKQEEPKQTLLLFSAGPHNRMAIPLSMVARLEEFSRSDIEYSGGKPVIRYRGQILPLIDVANHLSSEFTSGTDDGAMQVVVYSEKDRSVGLVVGRIDDIVSEVIKVKRHSYGNGILGSVVIHDQVTDLLDVLSVIRTADPGFATGKPTPSAAA